MSEMRLGIPFSIVLTSESHLVSFSRWENGKNWASSSLIFCNLKCIKLLNGFLWHISCIIITAVSNSWNIWGGYSLLSHNRSQSALQRSSVSSSPLCSCRNCNGEAGNDLPNAVREVNGRPRCRTRIFSAHIPGCWRWFLVICCSGKSQQWLLVCASLPEIWLTNAVVAADFLHQYEISSSPGAKEGSCRKRLLAEAGRNEFKGVLNQQELVLLFSDAVLFEHAAV